MLFHKSHDEDQIETLVHPADPKVIAEEMAALERENAEATNYENSEPKPTDIGVEFMPKRDLFFRKERFGEIDIWLNSQSAD